MIDLMDQVLRLAELTKEAGLDGVVASARETPLIRERFGPDFAIVTPGHPRRRRRRGKRRSGADDERRGSDRAGASYLVVGRPIIARCGPGCRER